MSKDIFSALTGKVIEPFRVNTREVDSETISTERINNNSVYLKTPVTQEKIEDAESHLSDVGGGEIVFPNGEHEGRFAFTEPGVTYSGRSRDAILKLPDGTDEDAQTVTVVGDNITVETLTVDGNKHNQTLPDITRHSDGIAIYSDHVTVRDVTVEDAMGHSIIVWGEDHSGEDAPNAEVPANSDERLWPVVYDCKCVDNGVEPDPRAAIDYVKCRYGFIYGCKVIDNDGFIEGAFNLHGGIDCSIVNNISQHCEKGVDVASGTNRRVTITGNVCEDFRMHGLRIIGEWIFVGPNVCSTDSSERRALFIDDSENVTVVGGGYRSGNDWNQVSASSNANISFHGVTFEGGHSDLGAFRVHDGSDGVQLLGCTFINESGPGIKVESDISDTEIMSPTFDVLGDTVSDDGTRTAIGGWSTNNGDPAIEGDWSGEGREGVSVYDTVNDAKYTYIDGDWR